MKVDIFGVNYSVADYEKATTIIIEKAKERASFGVSALAVHGLIECYKDPLLNKKVNSIDLVVADGQPIRWAINSFHNVGLKDRTAGPQLTLEVLKKAHKENLSIYLFGSKSTTLEKLSDNIRNKFPGLMIAGMHPDRFREATLEEDEEDIKKINASGANIVLVGRGCPRQEIWVSNHQGKIRAVMMAVGAAFDFHAGTMSKAPKWMEDSGLEWLYRLIKEPKRLWKRYLFTNIIFIMLFIRRKLE